MPPTPLPDMFGKRSNSTKFPGLWAAFLLLSVSVGAQSNLDKLRDQAAAAGVTDAAAAPVLEYAPSTGLSTDRPAPPRRLSAEERSALVLKLASKDSDHGGAIAPTPGSIAEAEAAADLYARGAIGLPDRPDAPGQGDFVDSSGRHYDVKAPYSKDVLISKIRNEARARGKEPPAVDPSNSAKFNFSLEDTLLKLRDMKLKRRIVILDTRNLNTADKQALEDALRAAGDLSGNVLMYP